MTATAIQERAGGLLAHAAGYVGHRTISLGLRSGLIETLASAQQALDPQSLARAAGHDPFYVGVWCRAALGCGLLERDDGGGYRLVEHADTLLLNAESPAYIGGVFSVLEQPEVFDEFEARLSSGQRMWWDETAPAWIDAVSGTGRPFFTRLVAALDRVEGLDQRLADGSSVLDTACGTGTGLVLLARRYPEAAVTGADGDAYSLQRASERLDRERLSDRVDLIHTSLEDLDVHGYDLVTNNVSMHECRDLARVTANLYRALTPGGWFVISDFPFPDNDAGLRTVPGRVMSGIQFFEALIDDQLLAPTAYRELLGQHGFEAVQTIDLTPVHALTVGRRAA